MEKIPTPGKKKNYLYHMVPEGMRGNVLHPLNVLKDLHPDLYISHVDKYKDRSELIEKFIPRLECLWNDVLFLSAVNPVDLKRALEDAGLHPKERKFYQIDPEFLDPAKTKIFLYRDTSEHGLVDLKPEDFVDYDPKALSGHSVIRPETADYFKESMKNGRKPKMFVGIPHILHKGSIDISDLEVITV
jgi:hypothetical protein